MLTFSDLRELLSLPRRREEGQTHQSAGPWPAGIPEADADPRASLRERCLPRLRCECGQVLVVSALLMTSLIGTGALVVDVGSWFRAKRQLQSVADAAALAGAQALPGDTSTAQALALQYAGQNGGGVTSNDVSFQSQVRSSDTISVHAHSIAPGFLSKVFGIASVNVGATAAARAGVPGSAQLVSPFTVGIDNPYITCIPACYDKVVTMYLPNGGGGGGGQSANFSLVDLRPGGDGHVDVNTLSGWLQNGYQGGVSLGNYKSADTSLFNSSTFRTAMSNRSASGNEVIILVHSDANGNEGPPGGAAYKVVGWAAFKIQSWSGSGYSGTMTGYFMKSIVRGDINPDPSAPDWGVHIVALVQ